MKKIALVTSSRADYGIQKKLIRKLAGIKTFEFDLLVTGSHLTLNQGETLKEVYEDDMFVRHKLSIGISGVDRLSVSNGVSEALKVFSNHFNKHKYDLLILLGDRYEMFGVAVAATVMGIPIAHIHGGESTFGLYDESFRHSITKMAHLHFTSTEVYRRRVMQLGEQPSSVFNVGSLAIEQIKEMELLSKDDLYKSLGIPLDNKVCIVTLHPVTLEDSTLLELEALLLLCKTYSEYYYVFTKSNEDHGGELINNKISAFVSENQNNTSLFSSLGQLRYYSALAYADFVIGNSSSGIIEAPSFKVPTINIGRRQEGRICSASVYHCDATSINKTFRKAINDKREKNIDFDNPYEVENSSERVINEIENYLKNEKTLVKTFYDVKDFL